MTLTEIRTHVVLPKALVNKIDARVGPRMRSKFIVDLMTREIARLELLEAAEAVAGSPSTVSVPEWDTPESIAQWVHDLRQADDERERRIESLRSGDNAAT